VYVLRRSSRPSWLRVTTRPESTEIIFNPGAGWHRKRRPNVVGSTILENRSRRIASAPEIPNMIHVAHVTCCNGAVPIRCYLGRTLGCSRALPVIEHAESRRPPGFDSIGAGADGMPGGEAELRGSAFPSRSLGTNAKTTRPTERRSLP